VPVFLRRSGDVSSVLFASFHSRIQSCDTEFLYFSYALFPIRCTSYFFLYPFIVNGCVVKSVQRPVLLPYEENFWFFLGASRREIAWNYWSTCIRSVHPKRMSSVWVCYRSASSAHSAELLVFSGGFFKRLFAPWAGWGHPRLLFILPRSVR
jgi:hypothetical protein